MSPQPGQPTEAPSNGDYAAHIDAITGRSPGRVAREFEEIPVLETFDATPWFLALLKAGVFGGLGLLALSERRIVLGGKSGDSLFEGWGAVVVGFVLLGSALTSLLALLARRRRAKWVALGMLLVWLIFLVAYVAFIH
jgi:hypothetical protein